MVESEIDEETMDEALQPFDLDYIGTREDQDEGGAHYCTAQASDRDRGIFLSARSYRGESRAQTKLIEFLQGLAGCRVADSHSSTDQHLCTVYQELLTTLESAIVRAREDATYVRETQELAPDEEGRYRDADLAISMLRKLLLGEA
jgi:hypothetical protein